MARATLSPTAGFCGFHKGSTTPSEQLSSLEQLPGVLPASSWLALPWEKWVTPGSRTSRMEMNIHGVKDGRLCRNMAAWWCLEPSDAGVQFASHVEVYTSTWKTEEKNICVEDDIVTIPTSDVPHLEFYSRNNLDKQRFNITKVLTVILFCMQMTWDPTVCSVRVWKARNIGTYYSLSHWYWTILTNSHTCNVVILCKEIVEHVTLCTCSIEGKTDSVHHVLSS